MGRLTEAKVRTAKPTDRDQWLNDGDGLYLRVRRGGSKVWIIRRRQQGKTQIITLDSYPPLGLKEARLRAAEYPLRTHISSATVVADLAQKYIDEIALRKLRRPELPQGYLDRAILPAIGHRKVTALAGRRHANVAAAALANKTARIAWTLLKRSTNYEPDYRVA